MFTRKLNASGTAAPYKKIEFLLRLAWTEVVELVSVPATALYDGWRRLLILPIPVMMQLLTTAGTLSII